MKVDLLIHALLQKISPSDDIYEEAAKRARRYGDCLKNDRAFGVDDWGLGGSFAKRTAIHTASDADVLLYLNPAAWRGVNGRRYKPATVLGELKRRLEVSTTSIRGFGHLRVREQEHSIRLVYRRKQTVDLELVPAFLSTTKPGVIRIPERTTKRWIATAPMRQLALLDGVDGRHQFVRRTVRLLKHWKCGHRLDVPSYALEVLVLEAAQNENLRNESALLLAVLEDIRTTRLEAERRYRPIPPGIWMPRSRVMIVDPAIDANNLIGHLDAEDRDAVVRAADHALRWLDTAEAAEREGRRRDAGNALGVAFKAPAKRRRRNPRPVAAQEQPPKGFLDRIWSWFSE